MKKYISARTRDIFQVLAVFGGLVLMTLGIITLFRKDLVYILSAMAIIIGSLTVITDIYFLIRA